MHWMEAAARAKSLLPAHLAHGEKQVALTLAAEQVGYARQSLRNIIAAYDFLESMEDENLRKILAALPYTSIEVYGRWAKYDRQAALTHACHASTDGVTVKSIIAAEKSARSRTIAPLPSFAESLAGAYAPSPYPSDFLTYELDEHLHRFGARLVPGLPLQSKRTLDPFSLALGIRDVLTFFPDRDPEGDLSFASHDERPHLVGILEVGERALAEGYRKLAKDVMARAIAGTVRYPVVLVVAPTTDALAAMARALPPPFHRLAGSDRQTLFKLAAGAGAILFTTATAAARDIYGE